MTSGIPSFIVLDGDRFRLSDEEEYDRVIALFIACGRIIN